MIRRNGRIFLGNVYIDLSPDSWGVAIAYNESRSPIIFGPENAWEVKYIYHPGSDQQVMRICTEHEGEESLQADSFTKEESFVLWALERESQQAAFC